ncbi:hypothetical protein HBI13_064690 [Parastagonospora nodorum]|nr:hypothetical protein HBI10_100920 [Parastagonospora nodorum]KAH4026628.1 hypothetical protein HBI13_064690 [Parastagonospora nodorum]
MAGTSSNTSSLPYHEPDIVTILVQTSLLLLLNVVNAALDKLLYCGLLGQVLIGIAWGTPGAKWLTTSVEETIVQLGYLGLILLVYEGGLHTSFQSLKANLLLSLGVAFTGIAVPIGLSYTLLGFLDASPVQAFAAGAALCSTSLGTTFTVLNSSGLAASRLGVVLTSAAMLDDVVGLVMVQVISNLGGDNFSWITVVRPVIVSIAFAVVAPLTCLFGAKPVTLWLNRHRESHPESWLNHVLQKTATAFVIHTLILVGLVTGATYAGTSNLFAAYIAGASISWWDSEVAHAAAEKKVSQVANVEREETIVTIPQTPSGQLPADTHDRTSNVATGECTRKEEPTEAAQPSDKQHGHARDATHGSYIYGYYYHPAVSKILQPLFFASIGFSIPITKMFDASIVWRGIVYAVLMTFGKLVCGLWLVRFTWTAEPSKGAAKSLLSKLRLPSVPHLWGKSGQATPSPREGAQTTATTTPEATSQNMSNRRSSPNPPKPFSLHPPLILALAMCARGEIGFLISGVAESKGVFSSSGEALNGPSDMFLVVTWAIVLCTIVGPLGVGLSVLRVKKLQKRKNRQQEGTGRDVLGVWGVE